MLAGHLSVHGDIFRTQRHTAVAAQPRRVVLNVCEQEAANATDRCRHTACQLTAWLLQHNQLTEATPSLPGLPCVQQCGDEWIVAQPVCVCVASRTV